MKTLSSPDHYYHLTSMGYERIGKTSGGNFPWIYVLQFPEYVRLSTWVIPRPNQTERKHPDAGWIQNISTIEQSLHPR